jgi:perosamine synthetase
LTTGPCTQAFEREFARFIGAKHALAVNSCTSALQLALDAIQLRLGDEVLLPTYTFGATAEVVTYFGARPVFCDCVRGGFNIDPEDAEQRITERTKAIIPVHIAGVACDMQAVHAIARRHNLHVIEDAAHALPSTFQGRRIGAISELTAFSFYATKTITTGEGGMLTTDNDFYASRIRRMRLHGISTDAWNRYAREGSWYYEIQDAGYKLNLPDILAAIGIAQLAKCERLREERAAIAAAYNHAFAEVDELEIPPEARPGDEHAWHLYILRLRPELLSITRNEFISELKNSGIGTSVHFIPLHLHPYYRKHGYASATFPQAEDAYGRCISLPIFPGMNGSEVSRVIDSVQHLAIGHRARRGVA